MSTMKNHLCSFLSRLAFCGLVAPLILLSPALVRADAITTFVMSGTAKNISPGTVDSCASGAFCPFSGKFQVDTTTGTVESSGFDITLPGLPAFSLAHSNRNFFSPDLWEIEAVNCCIPRDLLLFDFLPVPTPGSLVGLTGGLFVGGTTDRDRLGFYALTAFTITPVPEPSSLVLFASGMLALCLARRFGKKVGHPLSA